MPAKPSIVFAHGLWADGSCSSKVIPALQEDGHAPVHGERAAGSRGVHPADDHVRMPVRFAQLGRGPQPCRGPCVGHECLEGDLVTPVRVVDHPLPVHAAQHHGIQEARQARGNVRSRAQHRRCQADLRIGRYPEHIEQRERPGGASASEI